MAEDMLRFVEEVMKEVTVEEKHGSLTKEESWTVLADKHKSLTKAEGSSVELADSSVKFKRYTVVRCPQCPPAGKQGTDQATASWGCPVLRPKSESPECEASIDPSKHVTKLILRRLKGLHTDIDKLIAAADAGENQLYNNKDGAADKIAIHWLGLADVETQIILIREKETCTTCKWYKYRTCKAGYNLLMLTLADMNHYLLASFLVDIVCKYPDQAFKSEIVMGKDKPDVFSQSENCLRLGSSNRSVYLLECLPQDLLFEALLEVGPSGSSSMSHLLEANAFEALEKVLGNRESVQRLRETLYDPAMLGNFMNLKMTQQAIDFFRKIILFRHNFLIPKPSELCQPFCQIFCDAYDSERNEGTKCMREALKNIGWEADSVQVVETLTTQQMELTTQYAIKKIQKNCSFLLFCFANHGKIGKVCDRQSLSISVIHKIITRVTVPDHIPKMVIVQACLAQGDIDLDTEARLKQHSTTLLSAEPSGEFSPKHDFLPELAEQIKAANGKTSLQEMFTAAVEKVNSRCRKSNGRTATITPVIEPFAKRVILRRYDGKENLCRICEKDIRTCSQQCMICSTCHKWYHLTCLDIDEGHLELCRKPGFNWLCKTCYDRETKMGL